MTNDLPEAAVFGFCSSRVIREGDFITMSFQAYIETIHAKTGKTPEDFREACEAQGLLGEEYTATKVIDWLKAEYGLGRGHAMAIIQAFKNEGWLTKGKGVPKKFKS